MPQHVRHGFNRCKHPSNSSGLFTAKQQHATAKTKPVTIKIAEIKEITTTVSIVTHACPSPRTPTLCYGRKQPLSASLPPVGQHVQLGA